MRIHVPIEKSVKFLVPDTAVQADQEGRYLLIVGKNDIVEQLGVRGGARCGRTRVIRRRHYRKRSRGSQRDEAGQAGTKVNPIQTATAASPV